MVCPLWIYVNQPNGIFLNNSTGELFIRQRFRSNYGEQISVGSKELTTMTPYMVLKIEEIIDPLGGNDIIRGGGGSDFFRVNSNQTKLEIQDYENWESIHFTGAHSGDFGFSDG